MGRTVPTFTEALAQERAEWKIYREYLNPRQKKAFDEIFAIPIGYRSACSQAVKAVRLYPIIVSILFHHHLELLKIRKELESVYRD
jgi:hypothetical protein